jgi:hypothetical protein
MTLRDSSCQDAHRSFHKSAHLNWRRFHSTTPINDYLFSDATKTELDGI